jgi:hypothetical protein
MNEIEAGEDKPRNHGWYYKYCKLDTPLAAHQLHFFPIAAPAILRTQNYRQPGKIRIQGLLLKPTGISRGHFRRCDRIFLIKDEAIGLPNWSMIHSEDWLEYEAFNGVDTYAITII